jgi:hypothetical protein
VQLVSGKENAMEFIQALQPSLLVPLDNNKAQYTGVLSNVLTAGGSSEPTEVAAMLQSTATGGWAVAGPQEVGKTLQLQV